jgi:hypothetical protein
VGQSQGESGGFTSFSLICVSLASIFRILSFCIVSCLSLYLVQDVNGKHIFAGGFLGLDNIGEIASLPFRPPLLGLFSHLLFVTYALSSLLVLCLWLLFTVVQAFSTAVSRCRAGTRLNRFVPFPSPQPHSVIGI